MASFVSWTTRYQWGKEPLRWLEGEAALHPAAKMALILVCSYKLLPLQQGLRFPPNEGALPNFEPTSLY